MKLKIRDNGIVGKGIVFWLEIDSDGDLKLLSQKPNQSPTTEVVILKDRLELLLGRYGNTFRDPELLSDYVRHLKDDNKFWNAI